MPRPNRACRICRQSLPAGVQHDHEQTPRPPAPQSARYPWAERRRRQTIIGEWVAEHGFICPGFNRPPHPARDLTADHLIPRSQGGEHGPLRVLCRSCNSIRGAGPKLHD